MYKQGLVIGKFYPPHRGHKYLIDTALAACEKLTIIICAHASEKIPGELRASWLRRIHPTAHVRLLADYNLDDDDSAAWARFTKEFLGFTPDAVFTSEDYGFAYAKYLGAIHVQVDKERLTIPISGTKVRASPHSNLAFLEPCVRSYFLPRIVVLGAESTGTTTLARALAARYNTVWVPEYGRVYSEGKLTAKNGNAWESAEFMEIARAQQMLEDSLAEHAERFVICDTDVFATGVWHERYMGTRSPEVERFATTRNHEFYILTGDEIPFVQDGTRDGEHIRHQMQQRFREILKETNRPFVEVHGDSDTRLTVAVAALEERFPI